MSERVFGQALSRREWLGAAAGAVTGGFAFARRAIAIERDDDRSRLERIVRIVREFGDQGIHRTATGVDRQSGEWLAAEVQRIGVDPTLEPFSISRIDPGDVFVAVGDRRVEGVPLFDASFTDAGGATGLLGPLGSDAEIALTETAVNAAGAGPLGDARRANRHKALVCVSRGGRPGLCPSNADAFLKPFGPPVVQVSSEHAEWLGEAARRRAPVRVVAPVTRTPAESSNVVGRIRGADPTLPPFVVMTPRSGWYACASERGGGIVCWLEVMRAIHAARPARDVVFVASSGHELGHLGINAFVDRRPGIVSRSAGWLHLGANIGAAVEPGTTVQASDDAFEGMLSEALTKASVGIDRRVPRGTVPGGEAEVVHRGGGRYVSVIGRNALFHNPDDRGPQTVDANAIARFADAFTTVATQLVGELAIW